MRGHRCGIPIDAVGSIAQGSRVERPDSDGPGCGRIAWRRWHLPVFDVREAPRPDVGRSPVLVLKKGLFPLAVAVDAVEGLRPVTGAAREPLPAWARGTIFGETARDRGEPLLIVDLEALGRDVTAGAAGQARSSHDAATGKRDHPAPGVHADGCSHVPVPRDDGAGPAGRRPPPQRMLLGRLRAAGSLHTVAVDSARVVQVLPFLPVARVAGSPPELLGLCAWRRGSVPVLSVAALSTSPDAAGAPRRLVICRADLPGVPTSDPGAGQSPGDGALVGLPLDEALQLARVDAGARLGPPDGAPWPGIVLGSFTLGAETVQLLDVDAAASILLSARHW